MADGSLYDTDFVRWSEEQAGAIRHAAASGANLPLDWENLAEEIESLGKSLRSELRSRLATVIEHLLKLEFSPAVAPKPGWIETIGRERLKIEELIEENPSLRSNLVEAVARAHHYGAGAARLGLDRHGEGSAERLRIVDSRRYSVDDIVGDWLPPTPRS